MKKREILCKIKLQCTCTWLWMETFPLIQIHVIQKCPWSEMKHRGNSINLYTEVKLDILNEIILWTGVNLL